MHNLVIFLLAVVGSLVIFYTLFSLKFVGAESVTHSIIFYKKKWERIEGVFEFKWYTPLILLTSTALFTGCIGLLYSTKPDFLTGSTVYNNLLIIIFLCCYLVYLLPKVSEAIEFLIAKRKEREILKHDL